MSRAQDLGGDAAQATPEQGPHAARAVDSGGTVGRAHDGSRVVLVGCGKKKRKERARAELLYCSSFFRESLAYARTLGGDVRIVSAKYGLIRPEQEIEPYDLRLAPWAGSRWADRVIEALVEEFEDKPLEIVFLCGETYSAPIEARFRAAWPGRAWNFERPFRNLAIGHRRSRMLAVLKPGEEAARERAKEAARAAYVAPVPGSCGRVHAATGARCAESSEYHAGHRATIEHDGGEVKAIWYLDGGPLWEEREDGLLRELCKGLPGAGIGLKEGRVECAGGSGAQVLLGDLREEIHR